jgi:putative two-component system response regulator
MSDEQHHGQSITMKILLVDNDERNLQFLGSILSPEGYDVIRAKDGKNALSLLKESDADLVLIAAVMPGMSGFDTARRIKEDGDVPVILMTGLREKDDIVEGLKCGVDEFLSKPFLKEELLLKLNNILKLKEYESAFKKISSNRARYLKEMLNRSSNLNRDMVFRLLAAVENKDDEAGNHVLRLAKYSRIIAENMGFKGEYVELIESAAPLHDIGKIGIPDRILLKPGRLTPKEFETMQSHTVIGASILEGSGISLLNMSYEIALCHHEKWDGTGYPEHLKGTRIPPAARIIGLADVFDALTSKRPYKAAFPWEKSLIIIKDERGKHFDPQVVDAFANKIHEIGKIYREYKDPETALPSIEIIDKLR